MKYILFCLGGLLIIAAPAFSQQNAIDRLASKYAGQAGVISVNASSLKFLAVDDNRAGEYDFYKELKPYIRKKKYKPALSITEDNQKVMILARVENEETMELLMIVSGKENAVLSVMGDITSSLMDTVTGLVGHEHAEKLKEFQNKK